MDDKVKTSPFFLNCVKHRVDRGNVLDVARDEKIRSGFPRQRRDPLAKSLALICESELCPICRKLPRNAPSDGMTICDAHDKPAFALHNTRHNELP
jgi:hypothetical protein